MCQPSTTEIAGLEIGRIEHCTGFDRKQLHEIDIRVGAKLMERELHRAEYMRGFWDCFYLIALVAWAIYIWKYVKAEI